MTYGIWIANNHPQTQMNSSTHILYIKTRQLNSSTHTSYMPEPINTDQHITCFVTPTVWTDVHVYFKNDHHSQAVHHKAFTSLSLSVNSHPLPQTCTCMLHSMLSTKGASTNSSTALSVTTWSDYCISCCVMVRLGSIDSTTTHTLSHPIMQTHQKVLWCIWIICMQHMQRLCMTCV